MGGIEAANAKAVEMLLAARPVLKGIGTAGADIPGMGRRTILHAGPPVSWKKMCGPMRGAVVGALLYEGLARSEPEARELAASGDIAFEPCHHHRAVGPMAGIVSASMPVWIVENEAFGNRAYATLNEGLGKVLRYGALGEAVIRRLRWMAETLAPALAGALAKHGDLDLGVLIAQALEMGDEGHNRNRAGTSLFVRAMAPALVAAARSTADASEVLAFLAGNDHFFLNLTMPAAKSSLDPIADIPGCTVVSTMSRNGTEFGIRVSGLGGRWFTAPAPRVEGLYLPGFGPDDANPDIGDSAICETAGIGGFAMAAAPAIVQFVGGSVESALAATRDMYEITLAEHSRYRIPALGFRGTPVGIDIRRVVESGILPVINTGIAHREPGIGQVGAGLVRPPMACFENALRAFAQEGRPRCSTSD